MFTGFVGYIRYLGTLTLFATQSIAWLFVRPYRFPQFIDEMEFIGNQSLSIISLTGLFTGAVLAYQSWIAFDIVGTDSLVGVSTSLALARELGPVMTAIVVTGRAGAAMTAKIGLMRVSEQIDALEVMAISPKQYLIAPKIVAAAIATPFLAGIFTLVGNVGGYLVGVFLCGVDPGVYIHNLKSFLAPWDIYHGLIKSIIFGFVIATICCYKGYTTKNGAEGVGKSTNESVVLGIVFTLVMDYFLSVIIPTGMRSQ
ncbi:ABC transporter permease [bacterium]|nr:ABC transporter permease [bacterium]